MSTKRACRWQRATFQPPHAPLSAFRQVQWALGLTHVVLVQPAGYGFDNSRLLRALQRLGDNSAALLDDRAGGAALRRRVLVDNAALAFGF